MTSQFSLRAAAIGGALALTTAVVSTNTLAAGPGRSAPFANPPVALPAASPDAKPGFQDFIVVFRRNVPDVPGMANLIAGNHRGQVRFTYTHALKGAAIRIPEAAVDAFLDAMSRNFSVDFVEPDGLVTTMGVQSSPPSWGLDRVDQRALPLDQTFAFPSDGTGVTAYVIDTGIRPTHQQFLNAAGTASRVVGPGFDAIGDGGGSNDCNGHGTHVAGTIGGLDYGMAKNVTLVAVRVLGCSGSGTWSGVAAGMDWVAKNATKPAVANMSLGGGASSTVDTAVANLVNAGVVTVVAAGNSNADACATSPARAPSAITVGATGSNDARASYSNFGTCLDVFAPGSSIASSSYTSDTAITTLSGTSMASPHVAGLVAQILATNTTATPAQVASIVTGNATANVVTSAGTGSPNLLIYDGKETPLVQPPPPAPVAVTVSGLTGRGAKSGKGWRASATMTVRNASSGVLVAGAVVTGSFTVGGTGLKCTTSTSGACTVTSGNLGNTTLSTTWSVTNVTGTNLTWTQGTTPTTITITRP